MLIEAITRGIADLRASITLNNVNLSREYDTAALSGVTLLTGNRHATYEALYRTQPWVRAAVNRIARGIGRLPLHIYNDPSGVAARERVREGLLYEILREPWQGGNASNFKQAIAYNLLIYGNMVLVKGRPGGADVVELIPSNFANWSVEAGVDEPVKAYWFTPASGQPVQFLPDEVIHIRDWATKGVVAASPMEALRSTLATEDAAQRAIISAFERGARPIGAFSVDGVLKAGVGDALRAKLDENYAGAANFNRIMLLEGGAKWQDMSAKFVDMEMIGLRQITRDEVAAVFNIPPPSIGILKEATFSNITEQHLMEYMDTYGPICTLIEETLQVSLIDPEPAFRGQYIEFSYKEVLKGDPIKELDSLTKATGGPVLTPNEGRATQNLPPVEGGDELRPGPTTPGEPAAAAADESTAAIVLALDDSRSAVTELERTVQASLGRRRVQRVSRDEDGRIAQVIEEDA